jgi:hypothetical protein
MASRSYQTLGVELIEYADVVADDLEMRGYRVKVERADLGCPFVPTLHTSRGSTTLLVEVVSQISHEKLDDLVRYARSCGKDTRVAVCYAATGASLPAAEHSKLQNEGVGLFLPTSSGLLQPLQPKDLALHIELPERARLSVTVRVLLGPAYDQFEQGNWREGFEEACQSFESEARKYLQRWTKTGRILIATKKGPAKLTIKRINKATMGGLGEMFKNIQAQTQLDAVIGKTLNAINKDRIAVAHHKAKKVSETRLRKNVGQNMWAIVQALKEMI